MNRERFQDQRGVALIMVIAVIAIVGALSAGLVALTANTLHGTTSNVSQTQAFNLAEAGLEAGQSSLQATWPNTATPSPAPTVDPAVVATQFPTPLPSPTSTSTPFLKVRFYDDNGSLMNPGMNTAYNYDQNGNGKMWIVSKAATGSRAAEVMAEVQRVPHSLNLQTGVAIATTGLIGVNGTGNQSYVSVDPGSSNATSATVYDSSPTFPNGNGTLGTGVTENTVTPATTVTNLINTSIFPTTTLNYLVSLANSDGHEFSTWNDMLNLNPVANNQNYSSVTQLWSSFPRVIVIDSGDINLSSNGLNTTTNGVPDIDPYTGKACIWDVTNPGIVIALNGNLRCTSNADIYGVVYLAQGATVGGSVTINGMLVAMSSSTVNNNPAVTLSGSRAIVYNPDILNNLNSPITLSVPIVPNTWRQVTYTQH